MKWKIFKHLLFRSRCQDDSDLSLMRKQCCTQYLLGRRFYEALRRSRPQQLGRPHPATLERRYEWPWSIFRAGVCAVTANDSRLKKGLQDLHNKFLLISSLARKPEDASYLTASLSTIVWQRLVSHQAFHMETAAGIVLQVVHCRYGREIATV